MDIVDELKKDFSAVPPKWDEIRNILDSHTFTKEELATVALDVVENCFVEYKEATQYLGLDSVDIENTHSYYVVESLQLLLDYGFDPNVIVDNDNAMWNTQYIDISDFAAKALRLLLEHGGDPNITPDNTDRFFEDIDCKLFEDAYGYGFSYVVQCWLLLLAYGGNRRNGRQVIKMLNGNNVDMFKEFERYDYVFHWDENETGSYHKFKLLFYDKQTREVVARTV